jgi:hypothetical protein
MTLFTVQQKMKCCFGFAEFKFPVTAQRKFRQKHGQDPPEWHSTVAWQKQLFETGSVLRRKGSSHQAVNPDQVKMIHEKVSM